MLYSGFVSLTNDQYLYQKDTAVFTTSLVGTITKICSIIYAVAMPVPVTEAGVGNYCYILYRKKKQ